VCRSPTTIIMRYAGASIEVSPQHLEIAPVRLLCSSTTILLLVHVLVVPTGANATNSRDATLVLTASSETLLWSPQAICLHATAPLELMLAISKATATAQFLLIQLIALNALALTLIT